MTSIKRDTLCRKKMLRLQKWRKKNCSNGKENGFCFGSSFPEKKNAPKYGTFDTLVKVGYWGLLFSQFKAAISAAGWQQCCRALHSRRRISSDNELKDPKYHGINASEDLNAKAMIRLCVDVSSHPEISETFSKECDSLNK
ncbi:hypothetical protein CDAR_192211 [Caerostris darwini]|uniref:Uncharacterized protein n=1 Tax=Caerostris darwini TaxID=1538125 RepID=A0AAV4M4P2_9ARAC|nr:hypothetical protein CDAR_192211 [Caerostris darwini]